MTAIGQSHMNTSSRKIDGRKMNRRSTSRRRLDFSADHFSAGLTSANRRLKIFARAQ
jgi:hypothetical protein